MYKSEFQYDDMIVEVECEDVDEYNVYGHRITFMMNEGDYRVEVDPDFDYDTMQEIEEMTHEKLLEAKMYPDLHKIVTENAS
jgi:hypothetical protein